jgi:hypothetical protein
MKIWSLRHTASNGTHMKHERDCLEVDAQDWLSVFRGDEPKVIFLASHKKPSAAA